MEAATEAREDHEAVDGGSDFTAAWSDFFAAVRRARSRAAKDPSQELTLSQFQMLMALRDCEQMRVGDLAVAAGVAAPTATRMLDGLAREGVVERSTSPTDRRVVAISLTAKGEAMIERKQARIAEKLGVVFTNLSPAERERAPGLLRSLAAAVDEL